MSKRMQLISILTVTVLMAAACGSDDTIEATQPAPTEESTQPETTVSTNEQTNEEANGAAGDVVAAADFTVDHGCGFGFAKGSEAQDLALLITFTGEYTPTGPDMSTPIVWPADNWTGEIQTGTDLFSDWCNDAIEEDSPIPMIAKTWTIVEATLTVDSNEAAGDVSQLSGRLTNIVAESGDERITVDEIPVTNDLWGFFAG